MQNICKIKTDNGLAFTASLTNSDNRPTLMIFTKLFR